MNNETSTRTSSCNLQKKRMHLHFQFIFYENFIVSSHGLLTGKWLLLERSSLQWHNPPPTPLSKGPHLRLYLGCQPHSPHTYCTNKHERNPRSLCNYCQGRLCRENGLRPSCSLVLPAGSVSI